MNWANSSDPTIAYTTNPITAGNNSFDIWPYGHFSGSYNQIGLAASNFFAHITTSFGTGLTLKGTPGGAIAYTTPAASANATLTTDMTATSAIGSGTAITVGATSPQAAGKAATSVANPAYTEYLATQLQTAGSAAAGDTANVTLELEYKEN